jgi:hypothetical protein
MHPCLFYEKKKNPNLFDTIKAQVILSVGAKEHCCQ